MKAKDKAEELIKKYNIYAHSNPSHESELFYRRLKENSIECALICVEEIINLMVVSFKWDEKTNGNIHFWEEVRDELNKMR